MPQIGARGSRAGSRQAAWGRNTENYRFRFRIAGNIAVAKRQIPRFAYVEEVDVTALEVIRALLNDNRRNRRSLGLKAPVRYLPKARTLGK